MDSVFIKPNMMTYLNRSSEKVFDYPDKCQVTFAKVLYVNSEDLQEELNNWLAENENVCEVKDIKLSSCYFRDCQTKSVVVILYKKK